MNGLESGTAGTGREKGGRCHYSPLRWIDVMTEQRGQGERGNLILIVSHSRRSSGSTVQASLPSHEKESGESLVPVVAAMKRELTAEVTFRRRTPSMCRHARARENHPAYLWHMSPRRDCGFDFRLGRGRDGPKRFLGQFQAFSKPIDTRLMTGSAGREWCMTACWSHARRQFFEACN